jgi:AraC-like DNA-binding protein
MKYHLFEPCSELERYVERYYVLEHHDYMFSEMEINCKSNCYSAWVLNFGDTYRLQYKSHQVEMAQNMLAGLSTLPYSLFLKGKIFMFGVVFKGTAMNTFLNQRTALEKHLGSEAEIIWKVMQEANEMPEKIKIIEDYLLQKLNRKPIEENLAHQASLLITDKHGMITIDSLTKTFGVSDRHLRRVIKESLGVSPKLFTRMKRFNYVNYAMTNDEKLNWHEFIDDGGYYDQAHFIKDFVEFCGKAPSAQILQSRLLTELWES